MRVAFIVGTLLMAPGLSMATAPALAQGAAVVAIPFEPPLAKPIRYRVTKQRRPTQPESSIIMTCRFEREGDGFKVTVRMTPDPAAGPGASVPPISDPDLEASGLDFMQVPLVLAVSSEAEVVGLVNREEFGRAVDGVYDALTKRPGPDGKPLSEDRKAALTTLVDRLRALPPEVQASKMMATVQDIIDFAATEMSVGETLAGETEADGYLGGTLHYQVEIVLDRATSEAAFVTSTQSASPDELKQYVESVLSSMPPGTMTDKAGFPELTSQVIRSNHEISRSDGLLRKYDSTETITVRLEGETKSVQRTEKIERLD